jgi:tetratricopeptide (TPR) repeat protein
LADSSALQRVLERELARWRQVVVDDERLQRLENLLTLATLLGGILPRSGSFSYLAATDVAALLPNADLIDSDEYNALVGAAAGENTLPGLQPDVLGERFVLDRLTAAGGASRVARRLLLAAWKVAPDDLCAFVVRAASDYPDDEALDAILWDLPLESSDARRIWGVLAGDLVRVLNRSADPRSRRLLAVLRELSRVHDAEAGLRHALARAELYLGHVLFITEDDRENAATSYEAALALAEPDSEIAASAINNRGILRDEAEDEESAWADWSKVIAMRQASDEARACALNNRADVFARRGAHDDAVRDRTEVLRLRETSYNRRYIALARRSSSYLALDRKEDALRDLDRILGTPDIVPEQKASAMVDKGLILRDLARLDEARRSFEDALVVDPVFPGTHARVLVELAELARLELEPDRAREFLDAVAAAPDASTRVVVEALLVHARLLMDADDKVGAERILQSILANPTATARQKSVADRLRAAARSTAPAPA